MKKEYIKPTMMTVGLRSTILAGSPDIKQDPADSSPALSKGLFDSAPVDTEE